MRPSRGLNLVTNNREFLHNFQVKEIKYCTENYLTEFEKSAEVLQLSVQVLKDLKTMYTQLHEEWSRDLQVFTMTIIHRRFKLVASIKLIKASIGCEE